MQWFILAMKNFRNFSGRARRKEYWMFFLFYMILAMVFSFVDIVLGLPAIFLNIFIIVMLVPTIAICVRRLHDTGRSGWWYLINFVPVIGFIVWLVFTVQAGETQDNRFGPDPKAATA